MSSRIEALRLHSIRPYHRWPWLGQWAVTCLMSSYNIQSPGLTCSPSQRNHHSVCSLKSSLPHEFVNPALHVANLY